MKRKQDRFYWGLTEEELQQFFLSNKYRYEDHFYEYPCTNETKEGKCIYCCGECYNCVMQYKIEKEANKEYYEYLEIVKKNEPNWDSIMLYRITEIFPDLKNNVR